MEYVLAIQGPGIKLHCMKHKIHACLASQLKTLTQNDAFEYQDQVEGVLSVHLVELTALWLAQSMLEEQIFPFQQTNYPKRYAEI